MLLLCDAANKQLREIMKLSGQTLEQLTLYGLHKVIRKAVRPPGYEFTALERLSRLKHKLEVAGHMAAFYEVYLPEQQDFRSGHNMVVH